MEIIEKTYLAIKSRIGIKVHYEKGQRIVAWNIANLWQRSRQLNEEVYKAMLSRGYSGEPRVLDEFKTSTRDWAWLCCTIAISVLLVYLDWLWMI
jgi:cobalt/nickel transport system permease protein